MNSVISVLTEVREITAGCICCSLAGDFRRTLTELKASADPDHILIEPTGVGRLSDVLEVCRKLDSEHPGAYPVSKCITIVDVSDYEESINCFGTFYSDQIRHAKMLYLSHTENRLPEEIDAVCADIRKQNPDCRIYRDDFRELDDRMFMDLIAVIPAAGSTSRRCRASYDQWYPARGIGRIFPPLRSASCCLKRGKENHLLKNC